MRAAISFCFLVSSLGSSANQTFAALIEQVADLADVLAGDLDRERLRLQAIAAARLARVRVLVARQLLAHPLRVGLVPAPLDVADDALEGLLRLEVAHPVLVDEGDLLIARAVQDGELHVLGQLLPRRLHRHLVVLGERGQRLLVVGRGGAGLRPRRDGALRRGSAPRRARRGRARSAAPCRARRRSGHAPAGALNENSRGSISSMVKPETGQAKRDEKMMRSCVSFFGLVGALGLAVGQLLVGELGDGDAVVGARARSRSVREPRGDVAAHDKAVHHDVDVVLELLVELGRVRDLVEAAVDLDALEALALQLGELLLELALPAARDRRQQSRCACPRAAPARGRPSATRSGSRSGARSPANRARRRAQTAAAGSRRSR